MSAAHDAHPGPHDGPSDAHDGHEAFDGEPIDTLPDDEPRSPGWLPLAGLAVFAVAGFALFGDAAPRPAAVTAPPPAKAAVAAPKPETALRALPAAANSGGRPPPTPASIAAAAAAVKGAVDREPEKVREINKRLAEMQAAAAAKSAQPAAPPAPVAPPR